MAISLVLMGTSAIGAGMSLIYGPSVRRLSTASVFVISLAVAGTGMLIAAMASALAGAAAGLLMTGFGLGWFVPNLNTALAASVSRDRQGRAVGWVRTVHELSAPACVVLVEPLAKWYGPGSAMLAASACAWALAAIIAAQRLVVRPAAR
jgi:sugar phosphate permease